MIKSKKLLYILNACLFLVAIALVYLITNEIALQQKDLGRTVSQEDTIIPSLSDLEKEIIEEDLSYILVTVDDENASIEIIDESGEKVGEEVVEGPLSMTAGGEQSGKSQRSIFIEKASSGNYSATINAEEEYIVDVYLYDNNGEVKNETFDGSGESNLVIEFDKENFNNSNITTSF